MNRLSCYGFVEFFRHQVPEELHERATQGLARRAIPRGGFQAGGGVRWSQPRRMAELT